MRIAAFFLLAALTGFATGCGGSKPTPAPPEGGSSGSDHDRLQGMWAVVSLEGDEADRPPPDKLKAVRFIFEGDKLNIVAGGPEPDISSFTLDTTSNPKGMTLIRLDKDGKPKHRFAAQGEGEIEKMEAIYKFDGDNLVVAMSEGSGASKAPRPTEFKPKKGMKASPATKAGGSADSGTPDVFVVTFKKTTEPAPTRPVGGGVPSPAGTKRK